MDGPLNFAWRIDFPHVLSGAPIETLRGEFALINQAQRQQELAPANRSKPDSGFDLIVGNPPFVTARNAVKRELYRERWPRVSHMKFLLVCPFFEMSFGLLRPDGQLGFIVSNAFAKREFGKPLVEDFFPRLDLEKVVDCSGLMFPGHGTPTCIVFGVQRKPSEETPIRVTAILSGGGDLRTPPEESALWHTIAAQNDNPGYTDDRIIVADRPRKELAKHPWSLDTSSAPTVSRLNDACRNSMIDLLADDIGVCTMTNADDIFLVSEDAARRNKLSQHRLPVYLQGEELRNWEVDAYCRIALPYEPNCEITAEKNLDLELRDYLRPFKDVLESRHTFGNLTFKQAGRVWYEFERMNANKYSTPLFIVFTHIATHNHFAFVDERRVFGRHAQVVKLGAGASSEAHHLLVSLLNSGSALFWLQQVCFSKRESEEAEKDTYFEFSGGKVQQLPIPAAIADALQGKSNALAETLSALARDCWERGRELPSLALRKLFEKPNEAYHVWNASLPGYVKPHKEIGAPFSSTAELKANFARAQEIREKLRREMIARQEEMDWLVYAAYGLIAETHPAASCLTAGVDLTLDRDERPFQLYSKAANDFDKALSLIPAGWSAAKKKLWRARLETIRDNEHICRIEQPVYKRRWDDQWKVGNRWECGPAAYAQELIDAFTWWLSEKAEWHLEYKAKGGPIALADWSAGLFKDTRVVAAWPLIADTIYEVEKYKFDALDEEKKEIRRKPKRDDSYTAFESFFRETVLDQSVPHGIPPAKPWNELAGTKQGDLGSAKKSPSCSRQTQRPSRTIPAKVI